MYTLKFNKFLDPDNFPNDNIRLYVVRNIGEILYVGISKVSVWSRWFGTNGRMTKNIYNEWVTHDVVSGQIVRSMPDSLKWSIDLWNPDECSAFLNISGDLRDIENAMIVALLPKLNFLANVGDFASDDGFRLNDYLRYIEKHRKAIVSRKAVYSVPDLSGLAEIPMEDDIPF